MVDALKKLDRKFLIIAGIIVLSPIILILFLAIIRGCSNSKMTYEKYQTKMISAAEKYFGSKLPKDEAETREVKLSKLVEKGYIKSPEKALDDECTGKVVVRRNGSSIEANEGGYLNYTVDLVCKNYKTDTLFKRITSNVVESESGLYAVGDEYVFRGNKVKNFVNFFGTLYRIVSIDKDGIIKMIKTEPEVAARVWDNKYNAEVKYASGKTIYKDSSILSYLISDYNNPKKFTKAAKAHVVAYDVCIAKRSIKDYEISKEKDCSEVLENQIISLLSISDYAIASTDPDCVSSYSRSCRNYNYLAGVASSTWTLNSVTENTHEAFFISDGLQEAQPASMYNEYNIVIYIDGNELYTEGTGSEANPYIIK